MVMWKVSKSLIVPCEETVFMSGHWVRFVWRNECTSSAGNTVSLTWTWPWHRRAGRCGLWQQATGHPNTCCKLKVHKCSWSADVPLPSAWTATSMAIGPTVLQSTLGILGSLNNALPFEISRPLHVSNLFILLRSWGDSRMWAQECEDLTLAMFRRWHWIE